MKILLRKRNPSWNRTPPAVGDKFRLRHGSELHKTGIHHVRAVVDVQEDGFCITVLRFWTRRDGWVYTATPSDLLEVMYEPYAHKSRNTAP